MAMRAGTSYAALHGWPHQGGALLLSPQGFLVQSMGFPVQSILFGMLGEYGFTKVA